MSWCLTQRAEDERWDICLVDSQAIERASKRLCSVQEADVRSGEGGAPPPSRHTADKEESTGEKRESVWLLAWLTLRERERERKNGENGGGAGEGKGSFIIEG